MENKKIRIAGAITVAAIWLVLVGVLWLGPKHAQSDAERRPLAQMPKLTVQSIMDRSFMDVFEDYTLDQFPGRDSFRQIKSVFHYYVMQQMDNNSIYVHDGYAAKMMYPLNDASVKLATDRFNYIYETYLKKTNANVYLSVIPDKGYYLAEENGYLSLDYETLFQHVQEATPWAEYIDLTDTLDVQDYYHTDTHWRQEKIFDAAGKICEAMGADAPKAEDYTAVKVDRPFYGVYYGQAALPMNPDSLYTLKGDTLDQCITYEVTMDKNYKIVNNKLYDSVYDMERVDGKDMYQIYLSGNKGLLQIENPNATSQKELIVFRDSFGSSMVPLLVQSYRKVTLVDIREISVDTVRFFVNYRNKDVLFLFSAIVLNDAGASLWRQ